MSKVEIIYSVVLYIEQRNFASPETAIKYSEDIVIKSGLNLSGAQCTVIIALSLAPVPPGPRAPLIITGQRRVNKPQPAAIRRAGAVPGDLSGSVPGPLMQSQVYHHPE